MVTSGVATTKKKPTQGKKKTTTRQEENDLHAHTGTPQAEGATFHAEANVPEPDVEMETIYTSTPTGQTGEVLTVAILKPSRCACVSYNKRTTPCTRLTSGQSNRKKLAPAK